MWQKILEQLKPLAGELFKQLLPIILGKLAAQQTATPPGVLALHEGGYDVEKAVAEALAEMKH